MFTLFGGGLGPLTSIVEASVTEDDLVGIPDVLDVDLSESLNIYISFVFFLVSIRL